MAGQWAAIGQWSHRHRGDLLHPSGHLGYLKSGNGQSLNLGGRGRATGGRPRLILSLFGPGCLERFPGGAYHWRNALCRDNVFYAI